jgi:hypothetical protein
MVVANGSPNFPLSQEDGFAASRELYLRRAPFFADGPEQGRRLPVCGDFLAARLPARLEKATGDAAKRRRTP